MSITSEARTQRGRGLGEFFGQPGRVSKGVPKTKVSREGNERWR